MTTAKLNKDGIAVTAGDLTVFNYDSQTREYLSQSVEYLAIGVGLPACSCIDAPGDSKPGMTICQTADFTAWEYVADHRGEIAYSTETGDAVVITVLGDYPENTTTLAPSTPHDVWNGTRWLTDMKAQHAADVEATEQRKTALLTEAKSTISLWQTELQLGIISDDDKASLIAWMKYIQALNAVDTSTVPDINWPVKPE